MIVVPHEQSYCPPQSLSWVIDKVLTKSKVISCPLKEPVEQFSFLVVEFVWLIVCAPFDPTQSTTFFQNSRTACGSVVTVPRIVIVQGLWYHSQRDNANVLAKSTCQGEQSSAANPWLAPPSYLLL